MTAVPLPEAALAHTAFLAGHWRGTPPGGLIEELWLPPAAGVAQASVRYIQDGRIATIELIVVAAAEGRVVMRYNHFEPDYRTWETDGPIALTLTGASPTELVFRNLDPHPRHALEMGYRLTGPDRMISWVVLPGEAQAPSFEYHRVNLS